MNPNRTVNSRAASVNGFILGVHSVTFSPDGKRLAAAGGAGAEALKLWDTAGAKFIDCRRG